MLGRRGRPAVEDGDGVAYCEVLVKERLGRKAGGRLYENVDWYMCSMLAVLEERRRERRDVSLMHSDALPLGALDASGMLAADGCFEARRWMLYMQLRIPRKSLAPRCIFTCPSASG